MNAYTELYEKLLENPQGSKGEEDSKKNPIPAEEETRLTEVLLHPKDYPPVIQVKKCSCPPGESAACEISCLFGSINRDETGKIEIKADCTGCGECIKACGEQALAGRRDLIPLLQLLQNKETPVYAMIAPAFSGQFSSEVTSGKLRSAFKCLGFYGMMEVALFADILSLKEALEFDRLIQSEKDFLLTSCCCPLWVALIRKSHGPLLSHVPPSVSPMVACGRSIKKIHPEAKTVFIGPCLAKKAEAREPDITDAVDYVLTFEEVRELFERGNVNPAELPEDMSDQSSRCGRIYARTSGVSEAVGETLRRLKPGRAIPFEAQQADGMISCKKLLKEIENGSRRANFIEGMGCEGGCVGGPKRLIPKEEAAEHVNRYGDEAECKTPADNRHVLGILEKLGFSTVESLLDRDNTFTRHF